MAELRSFLFVCAALLHLQNLHGQNLLLHLRNGDRVSGGFLSETNGQITVTNPILGRLVVPLAQIERRELVPAPAVVVKAAPAPTNSAPVIADPALPSAVQKRIDDLQTIYLAGQLSAQEYQRRRTKVLTEAHILAPVTKPGPKQWNGEVQLGMDLGFGEKSRQMYTGRIKLADARPPWRSNFDYIFTYGRTEGDLSANRMDGSLKTDYDLTAKHYFYSLGGAGYDQIRKVDWRYELGPGAGYHLYKRTNFVVRVEAGFHYQVQNFDGDRQEEVYYHRFAQDLRWNLGPQFSVDEKLEYLPEFADFRSFKLRAEANLRYWLRGNLSLNLTVIDLYDTITAQGIGKNDLQVRSSIGLKF